MEKLAVIQKHWVRWFLVFGVWTLIGLSQATRFFFSSINYGRQITWGEAISYSLSDWYVFALASIPVIWLSRWFHLDAVHWRRNLLVHLGASALFPLACLVIRAAVRVALGKAVSFEYAFHPMLLRTYPFNLPVYWVIVGVCHALDYYQKYHERALRTSELETRLAQARLQALQMQLNPHFLFNSLNSISALMHKNVEAADRMLTRLSDLLRHALENTDTQEVPLRQELSFLERYLEIEQTRFGHRLTVKLDIAPETLNAMVPNLVLQPLVENAIKHGIEPHARAGLIEICARQENETLLLDVKDNGNGLRPGRPLDPGVGLSNTRARLEQLYGEAHRFALANAEAGGLQVRVAIPYRTEPTEVKPENAHAQSPHAHR